MDESLGEKITRRSLFKITAIETTKYGLAAYGAVNLIKKLRGMVEGNSGHVEINPSKERVICEAEAPGPIRKTVIRTQIVTAAENPGDDTKSLRSLDVQMNLGAAATIARGLIMSERINGGKLNPKVAGACISLLKAISEDQGLELDEPQINPDEVKA